MQGPGVCGTLRPTLSREARQAAAHGTYARALCRFGRSVSVLLLVSLLFRAGSANGAEPRPPLRIGVLDIRVIFERYQHIPALDRQLQGEILRYEELVEKRRARVEELEQAARSPGRPDRPRSAAQDLAQARAALRAARREAIEELRLLEQSATETVLADIRRAAAQEAIAQGLDVVVDRTDASILFVREHDDLVVDVTDGVLALMNAP